MTEFFTSSLSNTDPALSAALAAESVRQRDYIELIASENIVSRAVLETLGHAVANKTLEGYPGRRFHGGAECVDVVEQLAIDRAKALFGCDYVNVQPHSGTQANQAVFFALLKPGDRILSMDLAAGGHLSHGSSANLSGRWFDVHSYAVAPQTGRIDYDAVAAQAARVKPKMLIAGGSAYPRQIEFAHMARIAKDVGALFLVDMAHIAGLVAAGAHPSPLPHADIVTATTTKTLRGPRGGLILARDAQWGRKFQSAIFPGVQGSMHTQIIAAKAVCLGEALKPEFAHYGRAVVANAQALGNALTAGGVQLVSGGTDTHLLLLNLSGAHISGQTAEDRLHAAHITSNKNPIPDDAKNPADWKGLRLGVAAATTRGFKPADMTALGQQIAAIVTATEAASGEAIAKCRSIVAELCARYPGYAS